VALSLREPVRPKDRARCKNSRFKRRFYSFRSALIRVYPRGKHSPVPISGSSVYQR
jgi:hypothetical protein